MSAAIDVEVAKRVMGWKYRQSSPAPKRWFCKQYGNNAGWWKRPDYEGWSCASCSPPPAYSTDLSAAWDVVMRVQALHEGWRFSLLGGDRTMGYRMNNDGSFKRVGRKREIVVVPTSRCAFGWRAEFFGHVDPRKNYGDRHGGAHHMSAPMAIVLAALDAVRRDS